MHGVAGMVGVFCSLLVAVGGVADWMSSGVVYRQSRMAVVQSTAAG